MNTSKLVRYSECNRESFKNQVALLDEDDKEDLKIYIIERLREDKDVMKLYNVDSNTSIIRLHGILCNLNHTNLIRAKAQQYVLILQGIFRFMEELLSRGAYGDVVKGLADIQMKFMDMHRPAIMKMAEKAVATGDQGQLYSGIFKILDQLDPRTRIIVSVIGVAIIYIVATKLCGPEIAMEGVTAFSQYMGCDSGKSESCPSVKSLGIKVMGSVTGWFLNSGDSDDEDDDPPVKRIEHKKSKKNKSKNTKSSNKLSPRNVRYSSKNTKSAAKPVNSSKNKSSKKSLDMDGFPDMPSVKKSSSTKSPAKSVKPSKNKSSKKSLDMDGFPDMPKFK